MQGLFALVLRSSFLLSLHVVLGAMLGAAIAAYDASIFDNQDFRLALFPRCHSRPCIADSASCSKHACRHTQLTTISRALGAGVSSWAQASCCCPPRLPQV